MMVYKSNFYSLNGRVCISKATLIIPWTQTVDVGVAVAMCVHLVSYLVSISYYYININHLLRDRRAIHNGQKDNI